MTLGTQKHYVWVLPLILSLFILAAAPYFSLHIEKNLRLEERDLEKKHKHLKEELEQWNADAKEARQLSERMQGEDIETFLEPSNRALFASQLEPLASRARLSDLVYTLKDEQIWIGDPRFSKIKNICKSNLTIEAKAALDKDIFLFLNSLTSLPGRMDLSALSLARIGGIKNPTLGTENLLVKMNFDWLANCSREKM